MLPWFMLQKLKCRLVSVEVRSSAHGSKKVTAKQAAQLLSGKRATRSKSLLAGKKKESVLKMTAPERRGDLRCLMSEALPLRLTFALNYATGDLEALGFDTNPSGHAHGCNSDLKKGLVIESTGYLSIILILTNKNSLENLIARPFYLQRIIPT
jgi:hypothetical protein